MSILTKLLSDYTRTCVQVFEVYHSYIHTYLASSVRVASAEDKVLFLLLNITLSEIIRIILLI